MYVIHLTGTFGNDEKFNPYGYWLGKDGIKDGILYPFCDSNITEYTKRYTTKRKAENALKKCLERGYGFVTDGRVEEIENIEIKKDEKEKIMDRYTYGGLNTNGSWVCGNLSKSNGRKPMPEKGMYISNSAGMPWAFHVRPETVCQCTGIQAVKSYRGESQDNRMVFEGDVLEYNGCKGVVRFGKYVSGDEKLEFHLGFAVIWPNNPNLRNDLLYWVLKDIEIIGNEHEHPELLKEEI